MLLLATLLVAGNVKAAPAFSSYPTASATIYLDFDGHDVNNAMWNYGTPFTCLPAALNDAQIADAFNRVAEDYRPFNVNVTTDINKFLAAPINMRIRVVVTPTSAWYASVAGIAYVTSFTWGDDTPCFVFSDRLANDSKRVAEAISHESGHTLGLYHQSAYSNTCTLVSSYNTGVGTGVTSWGPIMGNAASKTLTQWNFGPTPNGCSIRQDNLTTITTKNGFGYRPDDVSDIYTNATSLLLASGTFTQNGVISTTSDRDIFRVDLNQTGRLQVNADPYSVAAGYSGANLDIKIELQNALGETVRVYDNTDSLNARIDTTLDAGTYYLIVDGSGNVNSGNDYGSLGSYTIGGSYVIPANIATTVKVTRSRVGNTLAWNGGSNISSAAAVTVMAAKENERFVEIGKADPLAGKFTHEIATTATYIYKLKIIGKDGSISYSNLVKAEGNTNPENFQVIRQAQQPVLVKAKVAYDYVVTDSYGRVVLNGKGTEGTKIIDVRNQPAGIYNIRLMGNLENKVETFMNR